jgi:hypothetical protein
MAQQTAVPSADTPTADDASDGSAAHFDIPSLVFENRSGLDAIQFDTVDQYGSAFHVVVAKTSYRLGARDANAPAPLIAASVPGRLLVEDRFNGDDNSASVLQESDFAPYKPACDVIVNATARAPAGGPVATFPVRLVVSGASTSVPLIDKTLHVFGERSYKKRSAPWRVLAWICRLATLGLVRPSPWRLTWADKLAELPLRYEYAFGGQCRIDANDPAAQRVPKSARLKRNAAADEALAHDSCQTNPLGRGFARRWYLDAKRITTLPAPRITSPSQPCRAGQFWQCVLGKDLPEPAGFGPIGRGWLPRRALAGTFEDKVAWGRDELPTLPRDFDFAYWNSAPRDQQCPFLSGQESFLLMNMCKADSPWASTDAGGNSILRFDLPQQALFLMGADGDNKIMVERLAIDTVVIDPDAGSVELVWRVYLPADGDLRAARLMRITDPAQIERLHQMELAQEAKANAEGAAQ